MKTCSRCKSELSNMYSYTYETKMWKRTLNLCPDCANACLTMILSHPAYSIKNFNFIWAYVNKEKSV